MIKLSDLLSIPNSPWSSNFSLQTYLPARQPLSDRWPILVLGLLAIYTISYLVHIPPPTGSKRQDEKHPTAQLACYALLPLAVCAPVWFWLTVDLSGETTEWAARGNVILMVASSSIRWTFSSTRPSYHPLSHPPFFASIRQTTAFKALNLPLMEYRLHGLSQYSAPYPPSTRRYLPTILNHLSHFVLRLLIFDSLTLLINVLDPRNLGAMHPQVTPGHWDTGMRTMSFKTGIPRSMMPLAVTLVSTAMIYAGVAVGWDQHAFMAVGSGLWAPEEWPRVMDAPWRSQSLNELWGKRYHTYLRNLFHTYTLPLAFLPRAFHIPRIFLGSAIHHSLLLYPYTGTFSLRANLTQYMLLALGCSLERVYYKATGRKVGGPLGRVWTWTIFLWSCYYGTRAWYEVGWPQRFRCELEAVSPVLMILKAAGVNVRGAAKAAWAE